MTQPKSAQAIQVIIWFIGAGIVVSLAYSAQTTSAPQFWPVLGVALTIAAAALSAGCLLGFLFGIPKRLQRVWGNTPNQPSNGASQTTINSDDYQANTNLEDISDWLTKILVGAGLTQLATMSDLLRQYAAFAAPGLGGFPDSKVFAVALLGWYLICGFLLSYLWTRLYLAEDLVNADVDAKVHEAFERQDQRDARARAMVRQQLNPSPDGPAIQQKDLNNVIALASSGEKDDIYRLVDDVIIANDAAAIQRTIPLLQALIDTDKGNHHEYHGDLGRALYLQADYKRAEEELTKAINMRGDWHVRGYVSWELNRALCRIQQDDSFKQHQKSEAEFTRMIEMDLEAVDSNPEWHTYMLTEDTMKAWLTLNPRQAPQVAQQGS